MPPGKSKATDKVAKKNAKVDDEEEEEVAPKKGSAKKGAAKGEKAEPAIKSKTQAKISTKAAAKSKKNAQVSESEDEEEEEEQKPAAGKRGRQKKEAPKKGKAAAKDEDEEESEDEEVSKKTKKDSSKSHGKSQKMDQEKPTAKTLGDVDKEVPLKDETRVFKEEKTYGQYFEEYDPSQPQDDKFFLIQIIETYKSTFKRKWHTFHRIGKVGEVGEWTLKGCFGKDKAIKYFEDTIKGRKSFVLTGEKRKKRESQRTKSTSQNQEASSETEAMNIEKVPETSESKSTAAKPQSKLDNLEISVDKFCPLLGDVDVFVEGDEIFDTTLNVSDIQKNSNNFYLLQILRNKADPSKFYAFFRWGRTGMMGEWVLRGGFNREEAIKVYRAKQQEKNKQNKYTALEINYTKDDPEALAKAFKNGLGQSKLEKQVAEFIQLIFDFKMMDNQMAQAGYDTKKLPLGKLSLKMINQGFSILGELSEALKTGATEDRLQKICSDFYTVIPQSVGWHNMQSMVIRDPKVIQEKLEFLESLRQIQIAYQMIHGEEEVANPIDIHYGKLQCDITPLDRASEEFRKIQQFVDNTKESYSVEIMEAFKINKHGSAESFKKDIGNHVMLWHGSRLTNFVGILSQGLRIAPPEAPVSGYRVGKGIYLADMIGKSIPYCYASGSNGIFCIMVCETALGTCNEKLRDDFYASNLPANTHSTKALGHKAPPVSSYEDFENRVKMPLGKPEKSAYQNSSFSHNEFVVYNVNQVQIRYLLKMKQKSSGQIW